MRFAATSFQLGSTYTIPTYFNGSSSTCLCGKGEKGAEDSRRGGGQHYVPDGSGGDNSFRQGGYMVWQVLMADGDLIHKSVGAGRKTCGPASAATGAARPTTTEQAWCHNPKLGKDINTTNIIPPEGQTRYGNRRSGGHDGCPALATWPQGYSL